ncbi:mycofactocin-coupled SDR family oxidoreductase [Pseudonocardia alni]|uniref:mycofactocin-coupled SDR family oxidoreductase n=1 Tax=Pseudonocardia alni TaxID=33907 RepID=UPI00340267AC
MGALTGKVAFVTGAARGQGRAHAVRLAEDGADVVALDLCADVPGTPYPGATPEDLAETVRLVEKTGRRIVAEQADVRDLAAQEAVLERAVAELGRLDIVVANAGITVDPATNDRITERSWETTIGINLSGVWRTCRAAIPHLLAHGDGGSIVITASSAGTRGFGNVGEYVAAKHGVVGLMKSLAIELGPHRVRVNTVHPSQVDTDMIQHDAYYRLFNPGHPSPGRDELATASQTRHLLPVPWVESVDVANAVAFLVSDQARYITGAQLPVDAGAVLK